MIDRIGENMLIDMDWTDTEIAAESRQLIRQIEQGRQIPEPERARIHALTRKVTMSDEELAKAFRRATFSHGTGPLFGTHWEFIKDLRDRYEERRRYAPLPASDTPDGKARG